MNPHPTSPFHLHLKNPPSPPSSTLRPPNFRTPPPRASSATRLKRRLAHHLSVRSRRALQNGALVFASCILIWLSLRSVFLSSGSRPQLIGRLDVDALDADATAVRLGLVSDERRGDVRNGLYVQQQEKEEAQPVPVHVSVRDRAERNNNSIENVANTSIKFVREAVVVAAAAEGEDDHPSPVTAQRLQSSHVLTADTTSSLHAHARHNHKETTLHVNHPDSTHHRPSVSSSQRKQNSLPRRVFSTASLHNNNNNASGGRSMPFPKSFLWPPEYGKRPDLSVLDVGANGGDVYTLQGWMHGHSVLAFEASPSVQDKFRATMRAHRVRFAEAGVVTSTGEKSSNYVTAAHNGPPYKVSVTKTVYDDDTGAGDKKDRNRVLLMPYGLANMTGTVSFFDKADCVNRGAGVTQMAEKCGKTNRIVSANAHQSNSHVRTVGVFRFDDLFFDTTSTNSNNGIAMINLDSIWFVKIDVEGYETEVVRGMRRFLSRGTVRYVTVEFSPNGRPGNKWGIELLEELRDAGFVCYHVRGFGQCHDSGLRSPSRACNFPFVGGAEVEKWMSEEKVRAVAPTFEQYTEVFVMDAEQNKNRGGSSKRGGPRMADLMCRREEA